MKRIAIAWLPAVALSISTLAAAADPDECAIWLCLPAGFVHPSCQPAKRAMIKRLFEFKGPVPSFSSCEVQGAERTNTNVYDYQIGSAALMGSYFHGSTVIEPSRLIVPGICNHRDTGPEEPRGCVTTLQMIKVFENGQQMGMTYFRNKDGVDYIKDPVTGEISSVPGSS